MTDTNPTVTQADREIAAGTQEHFAQTAKAIRSGRHDHTQLVQAFAAHRCAHTSQPTVGDDVLLLKLEKYSRSQILTTDLKETLKQAHRLLGGKV